MLLATLVEWDTMSYLELQIGADHVVHWVLYRLHIASQTYRTRFLYRKY